MSEVQFEIASAASRPVEVLYIGEDEFFGPQLADVFKSAGCAVTCFARADGANALAQATEARRPTAADWVVIAFQPSAKDVRLLIQLLGNVTAHLILISSYKVYPAVFRPSPWQAEDFNALADGVARDDNTMAGQARAAERELILAGRDLRAWTILRPALIEGVNNPWAHSAWFVNRILDDGLVVLPDRKMAIYRHVSVRDLARAALAVAGKESAFGAVLNVVSRGMLNYRGHARLLARALRRRITFKYVPYALWQASGSPLPVADDLSASFIASSALLSDLGWEPSDEVEFFAEIARALEEFPRFVNKAAHKLERQLYKDINDDREAESQHGLRAAAKASKRQWTLIARPGDPASLALHSPAPVGKLYSPILKTRRLAFGRLDAELLRGEIGKAGERRVIGHNALLEVVHSSHPGLAVGDKMLPVAGFPCGRPTCPFCIDGNPRTPGLDCDGYGSAINSIPPEHLLTVEPDLVNFALLASPLAALIELSERILEDGFKTAWIFGESVEAALLGWLMEDANLQVLIVTLAGNSDPEFPVHGILKCNEDAKRGKASWPDVIVDFSSNFEPISMFNPAIGKVKGWCSRRRPTKLPRDVAFHRLPLCATSQTTIKRALELLKSWSRWRDLDMLIGPAIPLDAYWDALMQLPFRQSYIEVSA
jgi:nucleoside-diphosphate-sugar epimerase